LILKNKYTIPLLNLLFPGWGYIYSGYFLHGILWQATLYGVIILITWSRLITHAMGLSFLLSSLLIVHIYSVIHSYVVFKNKAALSSCSKCSLIIFPIVSLLFSFFIFINKSIIFGFEIYKIDSLSMSPTLLPGDYIVSDTWIYKAKAPVLNEIVLFQPDSANTIIKRVMPTPSYLTSKPDMFYLLGDNPSNSIDSRYLGLINLSQIKGKAAYIFYARDKSRVNKIL